MLVARQCEPLRHTWSPVKLGSPFQEEKAPRMSNLEPITAQPDWRDSYSQEWQATENLPVLPSLFEQSHPAHSVGGSGAASLYQRRLSLSHRHSLAQVESRQQPFSKSQIVRSDSAPAVKVERQGAQGEQEQSYLGSGATIYQEPPRFESRGPERGVDDEQGIHPQQRKDEDEHEDDDEEMLEAEDGPPGDGTPPQTEAERRAERRKMKRFRLTHQQTRFLMSEFAKQAHPDAAHRERLSREIPGLSPRQVQVWFQNRRAKIKRLHADDRERMMKMRAMPDDFDNVQALHSPYGSTSYSGAAAHVVEPQMHSSMDFPQNHGEYGLGLRPLMVESNRRNDHDEHLSSAGIASPYGQVRYTQPTPVGTIDMFSSLSNQSGRYFAGGYPSQIAGQQRDTTMYGRHNSMDSYALQSARQEPRPIQASQPLNRSRSDSLQSPLRTSMSWKGDSIDYGNYQQPQALSPLNFLRQAPLYQGDLSTTAKSQQPQYSGDTYAATNIHASPQNTYSISHTSQSDNPPIPRFRSASAVYPSGLDLRHQYRPQQSPNQSLAQTDIPTTPRTSAYASAYSTGGFQSAPLLPAAEFQTPRTPSLVNDARTGDYHMAQLSGPMTAPMAAPQDFGAAYQSAMSPRSGSHSNVNIQTSQTSETQHAETVGLAIPHTSDEEHATGHGQHQGEKYHDGYGMEIGAMDRRSRKRTFSMSENYEGS